MKINVTLLSLLFSVAAFAIGIAPGPGFVNWRLGWVPGDPNWNYALTNYIPKTNSAWIVTGATNLASTNFTAWPVVAMITAWGLTPSNTLTAVITVPVSGQWFFSIQATNFQGLGPPSTPDTTGPLPYPVESQVLNGQ